MLRNHYITYMSLLQVPVRNAYIEDINAFFRVLAKARSFKNKIMIYLQQICC